MISDGYSDVAGTLYIYYLKHLGKCTTHFRRGWEDTIRQILNWKIRILRNSNKRLHVSWNWMKLVNQTARLLSIRTDTKRRWNGRERTRKRSKEKETTWRVEYAQAKVDATVMSPIKKGDTRHACTMMTSEWVNARDSTCVVSQIVFIDMIWIPNDDNDVMIR